MYKENVSKNGVRALVASVIVLASASSHAAITCISPPALSNPLVYSGKCPGESGFPIPIKARGRDVSVTLPSNKTCSTSMTITDARNITVTGGHFVYNYATPAVITIKNTSGTTFMDGLYIDVNKKYADGIRVYNHKGRLIVQNSLFKGISGTRYGVHGDIVHAQDGGPLQELTLQNVTGYTGYQGLFTPYRPGSGHGTRKLTLHRVNVAYDPTVSKRSLKLLYIGSADNSTDRVPDLGSTFSGVYADGSYWSLPFHKTVYAEPVRSSTCSSFDAKHKVNGQVCGGKPTGGDYVPSSQVGRTYNRSYFCN